MKHYVKMRDVLWDIIVNFQNSRDREKLQKANKEKRGHVQKIRAEWCDALQKQHQELQDKGATLSNFRGKLISNPEFCHCHSSKIMGYRYFFRHEFSKPLPIPPLYPFFKEDTGGCAPLKRESKPRKGNKWYNVQLFLVPSLKQDG